MQLVKKIGYLKLTNGAVVPNVPAAFFSPVIFVARLAISKVRLIWAIDGFFFDRQRKQIYINRVDFGLNSVK